MKKTYNLVVLEKNWGETTRVLGRNNWVDSAIRLSSLFLVKRSGTRDELVVGRNDLCKKNTDRSKAVLLLWIIFVIYVSCLSCFLVCSLQPCGHLLGKG